MSIRVRLFAVARERAGAGEVLLALGEGATVADLRAGLAERFPALCPLMPNVMIAVDAEYASDDLVIPPGAEVALIPPVSGGAPVR
ncbi:MAG: MoaD/ThiS family protein [Isosphaeraceae bacterium]|nr:MoaD/ThiS family protein [Isosphaeraceae bacterium]